MNHAIVALVVCMYLIGYSASADLNCAKGSNSTEARLRSKLFCGYDKNIRPLSPHTNTTQVKFLLYIKDLKFIVGRDTMRIYGVTFWQWSDMHFVWEPEQHGDVQFTRVDGSDIWMPDVKVLTSRNLRTAPLSASRTKCFLHNDGTVICFTPTAQSTYCSAEISRWPFDTHTCIMELGTQERLNITLWRPEGHLKTYYPNMKWQLLSVSVSSMNQSTVAYSFTIKRYSASGVATVLIPSLILAMLTLVVFWLKPRSAERMCLIYLNLLCHCLYLQYSHVYSQSNGDKYPVILLFFRDSLLLSSVSLIVTLVVRRMDAATGPPPVWITTVTDAVQATLPGRILFSGDVEIKKHNAQRDDAGQLVETSREEQGWNHFALLLDRAFFLIALLTNLVLLCAFLP